MQIPLEDHMEDIIGKAQKGLGLSDATLISRAGITAEALQDLKAGQLRADAARRLAPVLGLDAESLLVSGRKAWRPDPVTVPGLTCFQTAWGEMQVNSYLVWNAASRTALLFDTGAEAGGVLQTLRDHHLSLEAVYLTHTHPDHIAGLPAVRAAFPGIPVRVGRGELFDGALPVDHGMRFTHGPFTVEARETSGHARCGMTYAVTGLSRRVAFPGDALFAGSMGGPRTSWEQALTTSREQIFTLPGDTVLCPGHGPLTTVEWEMAHNPFYPEFKSHPPSQS